MGRAKPKILLYNKPKVSQSLVIAATFAPPIAAGTLAGYVPKVLQKMKPIVALRDDENIKFYFKEIHGRSLRQCG